MAGAKAGAAFIGHGVEPLPYYRLPSVASRFIIAVPDDALGSVAEVLAGAGCRDGVALHTCGSRGPDAIAPLAAMGISCGTLHPIQTVATPEQGVAALQRVFFGVTADGPAAAWASSIVALLSGRALAVAAQHRPAYHMAAVMAGNYTVTLVDAAVDLMAGAGIDRSDAARALAPLVAASARNALTLGPAAALTGPIARGDVRTLAMHAEALTSVPPHAAALYRAAGRYLVRLAVLRGLPESTARTIEALLEEPQTGRQTSDE
jgi:predicted short-subunit dehydrogenase-like oxidoreductase (DUF2520 family)